MATPPEAWITVEAPALRIVDDALWEAAHRRLDTTRARYARLTAGKRVGRPEPTLESPHLLTGFVREPRRFIERWGREVVPRACDEGGHP